MSHQVTQFIYMDMYARVLESLCTFACTAPGMPREENIVEFSGYDLREAVARTSGA